MTRTFYVKNDETQEIEDFTKICDKMEENYSTVLMNFIKRFNIENKKELKTNGKIK